MNTNIKDFLTPAEARAWAEYFAKECHCKIVYDYYYDSYTRQKFNTEKEGCRINYPFMAEYKFGLTLPCKKNIAGYVMEKHMLKFNLKQKGMSFVYVVIFKDDIPEPAIIECSQMELKQFITM